MATKFTDVVYDDENGELKDIPNAEYYLCPTCTEVERAKYINLIATGVSEFA